MADISYTQWPPVQPVTLAFSVGSGGNFATVTAAMTYLNSLVLNPTSTVTLTLVDGVTTEPAPVFCGSSFGKNIYIQGNTLTKTLSSVQSSSGGAGAWTYILNVNSVSGISVGHYFVLTAPSGGTLPTYLAGAWPITNVDAVNTRITITTTHRNASAASGAVTGTARIFKSVVQFPNGDGFDIYNSGSALNAGGFVVAGDGSHGVGMSVQDVDRLFLTDTLAVTGFSTNVLANYSSEINASGAVPLVSCSAAGDGARITTGASIDANIISCGNGNNGVTVNGASATGDTDIMSGNGGAGVQATLGGAFVNGTAITVSGNSGKGVDSGTMGILSLAGLTSTGNGVADQIQFNTGANGLKFVTTTTSQSGTTYSVLAADNSIILTSASTVTVTLPTASTNTGRELWLKATGGGAVNSASSNVVPLAGGSASTGILSASAGKWARLQSDGSNWIIMAAN